MNTYICVGSGSTTGGIVTGILRQSLNNLFNGWNLHCSCKRRRPVVLQQRAKRFWTLQLHTRLSHLIHWTILTCLPFLRSAGPFCCCPDEPVWQCQYGSTNARKRWWIPNGSHSGWVRGLHLFLVVFDSHFVAEGAPAHTNGLGSAFSQQVNPVLAGIVVAGRHSCHSTNASKHWKMTVVLLSIVAIYQLHSDK